MVGQERMTSGPFFLAKKEQQLQRYDQSLPHFIISHHKCSSSQDKRTVVEAAENKRWLLGTAPTPQFTASLTTTRCTMVLITFLNHAVQMHMAIHGTTLRDVPTVYRI